MDLFRILFDKINNCRYTTLFSIWIAAAIILLSSVHYFNKKSARDWLEFERKSFTPISSMQKISNEVKNLCLRLIQIREAKSAKNSDVLAVNSLTESIEEKFRSELPVDKKSPFWQTVSLWKVHWKEDRRKISSAVDSEDIQSINRAVKNLEYLDADIAKAQSFLEREIISGIRDNRRLQMSRSEKMNWLGFLLFGFCILFTWLRFLPSVMGELNTKDETSENLGENFSGIERQVFEQLGQAVFTLNKEGVVESVLSDACKTFWSSEIKGEKFSRILRITGEEEESLQQWVQVLFAGDVPFDSVVPLGPKGFEGVNRQSLAFDYVPIWEEDGETLEKVVVVGTNKTREKQLLSRAEKERSSAQMIIRIARDQVGFNSFVLETKSQLTGLIEELDSDESMPLDINKCFRYAHNIKSGAASFNIGGMTKLAHSLEQKIQDSLNGMVAVKDIRPILQQRANGLAKAFENFLVEYKYVIGDSNSFSDYRRSLPNTSIVQVGTRLVQALGAESSEFKEFLNTIVCEEIAPSFEKFQSLMNPIASQQSKNVQLTVEGNARVYYPFYSGLIQALNHVFRNIVDHGIEPVEDRKGLGKTDAGQVKVYIRQTGNSSIDFVIEDDGRGIDKNKIVKKAIESGLVTPKVAQVMNDGEILQLIFSSGLSTAEDVSEISGRGVGMDVVKTEVTDLGGKIKVDSQVGEGTRFEIHLPLCQNPFVDNFSQKKSA